MVVITFPNRETEKRALGFLIGRYPGRATKSGEHLVPAAALEDLADQGIAFTVQGKADVGQERPIAESGEKRPRFGSARGKVWMADDFDAPLEDFAEYM